MGAVMSRHHLRIVSLMARHGTAKYSNAPRALASIFARQMPDIYHETLIIDNALEPNSGSPAGCGATVIGGDNAAWEFSAWDCGLRHLGARLEEFDYVHLVSSAFLQLYVRYIDRFDADMLGLLHGRAAAIGHIDYYDEPVGLLGRTLQSWLRSSFLFLPPAELRLLGRLNGLPDKVCLFSGNPAAPFRPDAPISEGYRQKILGWLTGQGTGQGTKWHSRFDLSAETLPFFEAKTMAILNEQLLTSRLRGQGCNIVDATWLATQAEASVPYSRRIQTIPDWRLQLSQRDCDAAPAALRA